MKKYYKLPWTKEKTEHLQIWWPHFGSRGLVQELNLKESQIKAKADKLKLIMLPKNERICMICRKDKQNKREHGYRCHSCWLEHRKLQRRTLPITFKQWIYKAVQGIKNRAKSKNKEFNITEAYAVKLWKKQEGKCYFSGIPMIFPKYDCMGRKGLGSIYNAASLDRLDSSKGYVKENVVWACWACNAGKNSFTIDQYVEVCSKVSEYQRSKNVGS